MVERVANFPVEPFVTSTGEVAPEAWDDARGRISFHTLVSAGATPSNGLVAGIAIVEPGGWLAKHRHAPAEIYYVLEGAATVTIDGVARVASTGAAVFIPGNAWHAIDNGFANQLRFLYVFPADRFEDVEYVFAKGGVADKGNFNNALTSGACRRQSFPALFESGAPVFPLS